MNTKPATTRRRPIRKTAQRVTSNTDLEVTAAYTDESEFIPTDEEIADLKRQVELWKTRYNNLRARWDNINVAINKGLRKAGIVDDKDIDNARK